MNSSTLFVVLVALSVVGVTSVNGGGVPVGEYVTDIMPYIMGLALNLSLPKHLWAGVEQVPYSNLTRGFKVCHTRPCAREFEVQTRPD